MRSEDDLREAERFAVAAKESTTNSHTHSYAEGVQAALSWALGYEDEIPEIDYQTEPA
jgi:hypothetical protein